MAVYDPDSYDLSHQGLVIKDYSSPATSRVTSREDSGQSADTEDPGSYVLKNCGPLVFDSIAMIPYWRPIESAPKDGTDVLTFNPPHDEIYIGLYKPWRQCWVTREGDDVICPTHWMPLPEPPRSS